LNTMMMSFVCIGLVTIQWVLVGYTFAFGEGNSIFGDFSFGGLHNVGTDPYAPYSATIPHVLYCIYQLMFAIITAAIVSGGVAERMKFRTFMIFILVWTTIVYDPVAHWVWSAYNVSYPDGSVTTELGWVRQLGAIDFAGGTVVHITSGVSALVASIMVGPRIEQWAKKSNLLIFHSCYSEEGYCGSVGLVLTVDRLWRLTDWRRSLLRTHRSQRR